MIIISNLFVPIEGNEVKKKDKKTDEDLEMENKLKTLEDNKKKSQKKEKTIKELAEESRKKELEDAKNLTKSTEKTPEAQKKE